MYVCVCRGITEDEVAEAIAGGAASLRELQVRLGVSSECGTCRPDVYALLESHRASIAGRAAGTASSARDAALEAVQWYTPPPRLQVVG